VCSQDEECMLWYVDLRVGVEAPWGISQERVEAVMAALGGGKGR